MSTVWLNPAGVSALPTGSMHLWRGQHRADLNINQLKQSLSVDECARADAFVRPLHHDRYVYAHAFLRQVLAYYLQDCAEDIVFAVSEDPVRVKPSLCLSRHESIHFNLSHSGDEVLVGVSREPDVGVDVEFLREGADVMALAERFFADKEVCGIKKVPDDERLSAFTQCWTMKEAVVKAIGQGLSYSLRDFEVDFSSLCWQTLSVIVDGRAVLLSLRSLVWPGSCRAAVAVGALQVSFSCYDGRFILK